MNVKKATTLLMTIVLLVHMFPLSVLQAGNEHAHRYIHPTYTCHCGAQYTPQDNTVSKSEALCAQWLKPVVLAADTHPLHGGSSEGYYKKGQVFNGIVYSSTWREGTDALWNLNPSTYYSAMANPASLLYTVDRRGRAATEAAWSGSVCSTTAMKALGYEFPYTSEEVQQGFHKKTGHSIDILEVGDMLWTSGHVAGVIKVTVGEDGNVISVTIVEQAYQITVFEVTAADWERYFAECWTAVYRGDINEDLEIPEEYPDNFSIIFERGNNTYVTDYETMLFYIPTATTVFYTKDGKTKSYLTGSFPSRQVNGITVYDLAALFDGVGEYYFHTDEDETDICIKVIDSGEITVSGTTATLSGYENCTPIAYRIIKILDAKDSDTYNFYNAPKGYTSIHLNWSYRKLNADAFAIENIPTNTAGWKLEVFYETGYGWARFLSDDMWNLDHAHDYVTRSVVKPTCTQRGYTAYTCVCGESWQEDYVDAFGHTEGEATAECVTADSFELVYYCTACGAESNRHFVNTDSHKPGDGDGDGKVNNRDLGLLLQYLNGWDVQVDKYACDVNADKKVNNRDLGLLLQYLNDWDVQLRLWWPS